MDSSWDWMTLVQDVEGISALEIVRLHSVPSKSKDSMPEGISPTSWPIYYGSIEVVLRKGKFLGKENNFLYHLEFNC